MAVVKYVPPSSISKKQTAAATKNTKPCENPLFNNTKSAYYLWDTLMYWIFTFCGVSAVAAVLGISFYMVLSGLPAIREIGLAPFLFGTNWNPAAPQPSFGIFSMILSSFTGTLFSVALAVPIGVLTAVFLSELAPKRLYQAACPAIELMSGIPSVIYGLLGAVLLTPLIRKWENLLFRGSVSHIFTGGANLLSAVIVLAVMILPTIIHISEISIQAVPGGLREASLALGATKMETVFQVVLPAAKPGILSGAVLGTGRAVGEAMAVIMVSGNAVNLPLPFHSVRLLTTGIVTEMGYSSGLHRQALFSIGLVLFVFILFLNLLLESALKKGGGFHV